MKIARTFKMSQEVIQQLEELSQKTGKSMAQIVEEAITLLYTNENRIKEEIELYKKENEQLKIALKLFREKEIMVEKVEEAFKLVLEQKDLLIQEKDKRIEELQEQLRSKKSWWRFW